MKILVVGSGGREHAVVDALARSPKVRKIYVAPGNGGIREQAELVPINADDVDALAQFARAERPDLTFVGPEIPLSKGIVDVFRKSGHPIVGPTADQALLESSKSFAKQFFKSNGIPTAEFCQCSTPSQAYQVVERAKYPVVIKADGLAAGKGVVIAENPAQASSAIQQFMESKTLGEAGSKLVIEEFLEGEEASFHVFADGTDFQPMVAAQDHKRRFDGDNGPNTGGMGAYSIDTILSREQRDAVLNRIIRPTLKAAQSYSGILYAGLMLTSEGPKLLEYNARFGDPETQVILSRLKTDFLGILLDLAEHRLSSMKLEWRQDAAATVVLVAGGYPGKVENGKQIFGLEEVKRIEGVKVYHAGTRAERGKLYTAGGRVLNVTARGATLAEALERAYFVAQMIEFEGKDYRKDIGKKGLAKQQ
ncbi:MAG TPA: phosphoribosylamine--glycine ligase, partial [Terriglobia bacterium]|nr:phosphoribosylamine--glycine ligase [Terriglobia bacterium]